MTSTPSPKKKWKGTPIEVPGWWMHELREKTIGYTDQGIADVVRAARPEGHDGWDRSTIGKYRKGKFQTRELTEALCEAFGLTMPFFVAETKQEALAMLSVQREHERIRREAHAAHVQRLREGGTSTEAIEKVIVASLGADEIKNMNETAKDAEFARKVRNAKARKRRALSKQQ